MLAKPILRRTKLSPVPYYMILFNSLARFESNGPLLYYDAAGTVTTKERVRRERRKRRCTGLFFIWLLLFCDLYSHYAAVGRSAFILQLYAIFIGALRPAANACEGRLR